MSNSSRQTLWVWSEPAHGLTPVWLCTRLQSLPGQRNSQGVTPACSHFSQTQEGETPSARLQRDRWHYVLPEEQEPCTFPRDASGLSQAASCASQATSSFGLLSISLPRAHSLSSETQHKVGFWKPSRSFAGPLCSLGRPGPGRHHLLHLSLLCLAGLEIFKHG